MRVRALLAVSTATLMVCVAFAEAAEAQTGTISANCIVAGNTQPCEPGWYTSPVSVVWQAVPPPLSTSGCSLGVQNLFAADTSTSVECEATWDGGTVQAIIPLHVEISAPAATATPDRPPDANGWYNHPLTVTLAGSAFSGIAACTAPQAFAGPATASTALAGSCTDNAGKTASASFPFRYDATPPALSVASQPADGSVDVSWRASAGPAPLQWVQVSRDPGVAGVAAGVVYQGAGTSYQDKRVRNGTRYTYTITAMDQAGNGTRRVVSAKPGVRLLAPAAGARLGAPPALSWTAVPKASYYNVQLFKGRAKVLSAWPTKPSFKVAHSWKFGGRRHRLAPGSYRWYVWPGYGRQSANHYGRPVGHATFVIK